MLVQRGQDLLSVPLAPFPSLRALLSPWDVTQTPGDTSQDPTLSPRTSPPARCPTQGVSCSSRFVHQQTKKKGTERSCAPTSNSPTCLPGQPILLLCLAGSAAWPPTLPSIPSSVPGRKKNEGEKEKVCAGQVEVGRSLLIPAWAPGGLSVRIWGRLLAGGAGQCPAGLSGASSSTSRCSPGHLCPPWRSRAAPLFPGLSQPRARSSLAAAQLPSSIKLGGPGTLRSGNVAPARSKPSPSSPAPANTCLASSAPHAPALGSLGRGLRRFAAQEAALRGSWVWVNVGRAAELCGPPCPRFPLAHPCVSCPLGCQASSRDIISLILVFSSSLARCVTREEGWEPAKLWWGATTVSHPFSPFPGRPSLFS